MRHRRWMCAIFIGLFGILTPAAWSAPGDVDTSFGTGGKAIVDFSTAGSADVFHAVALQPDGKIVVAGDTNFADPNFNFGAIRLLTGGALDTNFGLSNSGKTFVDFFGTDLANDVALQPDGGIVVAGTSNASGGNFNYTVTRFTSTGALDSSFAGGGGGAHVDMGGTDQAKAVALQTDGKIVMAGSRTPTSGTNDFAVLRLLNPQATPDTSFAGGTGKAFVDFGADDQARDMKLQTDGKIVVAGDSGPSGSTDFAVTRLLSPQGTPDTTFGGGTGKVIVNMGGADVGNAMALQADGKIVVAGYTGSDFAVARLTSSGALDTTFGGGTGKAFPNFGGTDRGYGVAVQPNGKIVVVGTTDVGGTTDFAVTRLLSNGTLDPTFGSAGKAILNLGGTVDRAEAVAIQSDGKIVAAGYSTASGNEDIAVARFIGGEPTGYVRPKSAPTMRLSLVPAYRFWCSTPNRMHGPPLAFSSCHPPVQQSDHLTLGTPDANGATANSSGWLRLSVQGTPGPPDDSDVAMTLQLTDVRCRAGVSTCGSANAAGGADYTGELYSFFGATGRVTDKYNDATGSAGATEMGTVQDHTFNGGTATCSSTASTAIGATCTFSTSANAILPGTVKEGKRAIWQPNSGIWVMDGGSDGDVNSPPNQTFVSAGVFVP